ncbi:DUF998 domain-containing protein [Nocardia sp. CC227C]|uniref:DUF998 domain-containing protein n=1 Tax=Nocardia sp. CC227C TaxID=3044562 RepID=UPI00278C406E|nr:DUF998 domain-containing protein [Nocardia sp. CC227C]
MTPPENERGENAGGTGAGAGGTNSGAGGTNSGAGGTSSGGTGAGAGGTGGTNVGTGTGASASAGERGSGGREYPPESRFRRMLRWGLAVLIVLAGASYSSWVLEFVLPVGIDPFTSFLSQLAERGAPFRGVFTTADTLTGAMLVVAAGGGLLLFPRRGYTTVGWVALGCFGAATIADALAPLDPAAEVPAGESPLFPQLHQVHALTSTLAVFSIFIAMLAFAVAAFRYRRWPIVRHAGLWVLVIGSVATAWLLIADNLPGDHGLGIAQRVQVGAMSLWLMALGAQVAAANRHATPPVGMVG